MLSSFRKDGQGEEMTDALIVITVMCVFLSIHAVRRRDGTQKRAVVTAVRMFINVLPILVVAFIIAGFIQVLLPAETIAAWLGKEAGLKGLVIAPVIGALVQGGPFTFFPLLSSVFLEHIGIGAAIAMITGWGMINIGHLPYEFAFLGPRFVLLKLGVCILIPPVSGLIAHVIFG